MSDPSASFLQLVALEAGMAALAVVAGFALAAVPNVELVTFTVFFAGVLLGKRSGARVGLLAGALFGVVNPWGAANPVLLVALTLSRGVIGLLGGWMRPHLLDRGRRARVVLFALSGALATTIFYALTSVADAITMNRWESVLLAIPFAATGIAWNAVVFAVVGAPCLEIVRHIPIPGLVTLFRERK